MAKKIDQATKPAKDATGDELEILVPERDIEIAGVAITVREYSFIEGLKLRSKMQPLIDALYKSITATAMPELEDIIIILSEQNELVVELVAQSANVAVSWIEELGQEDGYRLMLTWWAVNGPFFVSTAVQRVHAAMAVKARQLQSKAQAGHKSGHSSSLTGTPHQKSKDIHGDS